MGTTRGARTGEAAAPLVSITRLAAGGDGVGSLAGKVVFVPRTAPGDVVAVAIVEDRTTYLRALPLRLQTRSPQRTEPRCALFGACGGCSWQHLAYPHQLEAKRSIVEDAVRRIGRCAAAPVSATLASPAAYGYRHRARLHVAGGETRVVFGFYRAASRSLVPVERCPVLHPGLDGFLPVLAEIARRDPGLFTRCGEVRIDTDFEGRLLRLALRSRGGAPLAVPPPLLAALRAAAPGAPTILAGATAGQPLPLGPDGDPGALESTGETFTQVNLAQNLNLVRVAMELAAPRAGERVLDLFCGIGNLSLPAAARGASVLGIDRDREAVRQAAENARRLGREAARFEPGDAAAAARALAGERRRFDLVLLNPPRTGARETVAALPALAPPRIVMVSCDPATFARDAALLGGSGYRLAAVQPLDLFPQTSHVETVGLLESPRSVRTRGSSGR